MLCPDCPALAVDGIPPRASCCCEDDDDGIARCFICDAPLLDGEMVLPDVGGGFGHRACYGEDRDGYVKDIDTGEPLGPDDPIPAGYPWTPDP